jgi:hypothetical protein
MWLPQAYWSRFASLGSAEPHRRRPVVIIPPQHAAHRFPRSSGSIRGSASASATCASKHPHYMLGGFMAHNILSRGARAASGFSA